MEQSKETTLRMPRGIRNCNPLNIRRNRAHWIGQRTEQTDPEFVQFQTMAFGFRAAFRVMKTYQRRSVPPTVAAIINRWAPPAENNTSAYVLWVETWMRRWWNNTTLPIEADDERDRRKWRDFIYLMACYENGLTPKDVDPMHEEILKAQRMA